MASTQQAVSSASDADQQYAKFDERKRKRMESNRESARRSRMRKQQRLGELMSETTQLHKQNSICRERIDSVERNYRAMDAENNVLRAQIAELTERLNSLNSLTQFWADATGFPVDLSEIPDTLLEPWQLPCPIQPIDASSDMLLF
ncbi:PREDICTED: bZIP transcription factor 53-like [Nicotiana attenuata]|uniref:Bzip transcription factor 53 n=1 Tax=Nicotiana attenuata TaxID=49451 RepID=A0A1J6J827_NICAT|nr:PREDICTED: bZIP transcription factor 53-like [Nicotiana attenuata]OIT06979.1 bzip transcription factor 53 [Nicotiana attenuata]